MPGWRGKPGCRVGQMVRAEIVLVMRTYAAPAKIIARSGIGGFNIFTLPSILPVSPQRINADAKNAEKIFYKEKD